MPGTRTEARLDVPAGSGIRVPRPTGEDFGQWSENVARFFGTGRYLTIQTVIVAIWILLNSLAVFAAVRWDAYPFILLNLVFSTQAAYAAPFILLAQNRQADRDRVQIEQDRLQAAQHKADTDFISIEIASLRQSQGEMASRDFVRSEVARQLQDLRELIREDLRAQLDSV
jgi:uncharacterized membrane protein